ncbi:MAG: ATP-binding protein, partial [Chitinispirillaceae bacterium]|nr:ATP-binding protein [Chitinispirillaceae bacterium]
MRKKYIKREIERVLRKYVKNFPAVSIIGPRQTGKTTLLKKIYGSTYNFISLDNLSIRNLAISDPKTFIETYKPPLIIDEVQYAPQLFPYMKIKIDENRVKKGQYLLTGSQNFLLMKSVTETLAGRIGILSLLPLSFEEISSFVDNHSLPLTFEKFCTIGTYPQLWSENIKEIYGWYESYIQTYIERDIKTLYNIGNILSFATFFRILASRCGQILNMNSLATDVGVTIPTIKNWISILEASGTIYLLYPYYANIRTRLIKSPKVYFLDNGLVCHINNIDTKEKLFKSPMLGYLFENFIISEVVKKLRNKGIRERIFFFRSSKGVEIDLVIEKNINNFILIEIKAGKMISKEMASPIETARKINKNFEKSEGYI